MFVRAALLSITSLVSAIKQDQSGDPTDWDFVEGKFQHPIQMESKDFTQENPHMEQAILDEANRESNEFELDRSVFVKNMAELREEAFSQLATGRSLKGSPDNELVPKLRKIQLR
jgi:hypothetical protein